MESKEGTSTHSISEMVSNDYTYFGMIPTWHLVNNNLAERPNAKRKFYNVEKESNKKKKTASEQYTQVYLQNDIGKASIHILNNDCLIHIFQFLPIIDRVCIERVCKRWKDVSQDSWYTMKRLDFLPSTWGYTYISDGNILKYIKIYENILKYMKKILPKCGRFLTQINGPYPTECRISNYNTKYLDERMLTIIGKSCSNNLQNITTPSHIFPLSIRALAHNCRNIRRLNLGTWRDVCDDELKNLFKLNQNLEYLEIKRGFVNGEILLYLPEQIHTIIFNECFILSDLFPMVLQRFENLKHLKMNAHSFFLILNPAKAKRTLEVLGRHCKNLIVLELNRTFACVERTDLSHLFHLVNLQVLKVTFNLNITDEFLANLVKRCQQLISLDITGCRNISNNGLNAIATLVKLEKLSIGYIKSITDHGLLNMCNLKKLRCQKCRYFSDQGISMFIKSSPQLELLDLSYCRRITKFILEAAKDACNTRSNNVMLKMIVGRTSIDPHREIHQKYQKLSTFTNS